MKWRVVGLETHDAFFNMALDEAVSEGIMNGSSPRPSGSIPGERMREKH